MKLHPFLVFSLFFILPFQSKAQSSVLDRYVSQALEKNLSIQEAQIKRNKQLLRIEQANKNWMPSVDLNANYIMSAGGRAFVFPIGDLFNPVYGTLNQLTQTSQFPEGLENQKINLTPNNFLDAQLSITQPIVNSSIRYNQMIQRELIRLDDLEIEEQKKEIIFQTRSAYYNYLKSIEGFRILDETESLLKDVMAINQKLVKYDKATVDVIADVEFQLANLQSERVRLKEQQILAQSYFNILLDRPLDTEIEIDEQLISAFKYQVQDLANLISQAKQNRLEFKKINVANQVNELNKIRIDREKMPTLGVTGAVGLQTEEFDFDTGGPIYTLALGASVNLFDGGRRKKRIEEIRVDQNILANQQAQLTQQVEIQVTQAYYSLKSLESQLAAEKAAARSARKSYAIIKSKYENEKAILLQLTEAQNRLVTSDLRQSLTKYDYLVKLAELDRLVK